MMKITSLLLIVMLHDVHTTTKVGWLCCDDDADVYETTNDGFEIGSVQPCHPLDILLFIHFRNRL